MAYEVSGSGSAATSRAGDTLGDGLAQQHDEYLSKARRNLLKVTCSFDVFERSLAFGLTSALMLPEWPRALGRVSFCFNFAVAWFRLFFVRFWFLGLFAWGVFASFRRANSSPWIFRMRIFL